MNKDSKIYVAGHNGMVGSAITRMLQASGYENLIFTPYPEFDLTHQETVSGFFRQEKPDFVFLAAAKVGGIMANNTYRAQFIYENIMIQSNVIHSSYLAGVRKLLFLGSSCIYPRNCPQPIREEYLLTGELENTNEPYAVAKIAGLKMCEAYNQQYGTDFIAVMPTNLYGPNDNYDLETSHVLPALIRKLYLGKCLMDNDINEIRRNLSKFPLKGCGGHSTEQEILKMLDAFGIRYYNSRDKSSGVVIVLWGSGKPLREFLHVDDLAAACVYLMSTESHDVKKAVGGLHSHINIGSGMEITIHDLAAMAAKVTGFTGKIEWDRSKPDGTYRKLLDSSVINRLGWHPAIGLEQGMARSLASFIDS